MAKPARARSGGEQGIAETLAKLDLSNGTEDAEAAAQQAVEGMESVDDGATAGIVVPPPRDDDAGEDDGADEEEEDSSSAGSGEMTPLPPVIPAPLIPSPKQARAEKPRRGGTPSSKLGVLAKMAPGAAKVKVYKRRDTGELDFVRDYNANDVSRFPDFESFLRRYCEPQYGAGEYELVGVDDRNNESNLGTIRLIEPPKHSAETGVVKLVESVLSRSEELNKQAMERLERGLREAQMGQQNPIEMMKGVMEMTDALEQKAGGGKQDLLAMMMAQQQQSTQMLISMMNRPKDEDPLLKTLLAKIIDKEISGGSSGALPPPPPPPPPTSFLEKIDLAAALSGVAAVVTALGALGFGKKDNNEMQLYLKLLEIQNSDKITPKELIGILKNDGPPADTFTDTVDKIAALLNVAKNLDPGGSPQNGIMDVLAALAGNRDLGAGVMRLVGAKLGGGQQPPAGAAQQQAPVNVAQLQQLQQNLLKAREAIIAERKKLEADKKAFAASLTGNRTSDDDAEPSQAASEAPSPTPNGGGEAKNNASDAIQLPPQTREFLDLIGAAEDEAQRAKALTDFLLYFQSDENMRSFAEDTMRNIREGNRAKALKNLHTLFNMFVNEGFMTVATASATLKLLNTHAEEFEKVFSEVRLESDGEVTRDSLMAPPPPA
jgi:hypothetical protein